MRKKHVHEEGRSMKTLFLYAALVFLLILISFSIKGFFLLQKSKFDGHSHFTVAIVNQNNVEEIISFNPRTPSYALLSLKGDAVPLSSLGKTLAISADSLIQSKDSLPVGEDVPATMMTAIWRFPAIHTDMTIVDVVRLFILSKNIQEDNKIVKEINLPAEESDIDKIMTSFFGDDRISSENISIRIVNASDIPGVGKRLERVLNNLGCNVIGVSTSPKQESKSQIHYVGDSSYTLQKLHTLLHLPLSQLDTPNTGDIVIIIGEDSKKSSSF